MKERPILMSAPMVRAILEGRKTQTRRIVKPQPCDNFMPEVGIYHPTLIDRRSGEAFPGAAKFGASDLNEGFPCPYGQPGDRLWVKETFQPCPGGGWWYREEDRPRAIRTPWKPSIFMPRAASRITLEITDIRAERLQDISEADAWAEGIGRVGHPLEALFNVFFNFPKLNIGALALLMPKDFAYGDDPKFPSDRERITWVTARGVYAALWDSINSEKGPGEHGYSWAGNPWVWVIDFKPITA